MTDLQKAKLTRNAAVVSFLENNKEVFEKDNDLIHFYNKLVSDHAQSLVSAEDLSDDDTSFSTAKLAAKKDVCEMARSICNTAKTAFSVWGDKELYKKTKVGFLHFFRSNDFYTEQRLKELYKLLSNHLKSLSPEYITQEQLDLFRDKIKIFIDAKGSSSINDRPPVDVVTRLKMDLKVIEVDIHYIFSKALKFKKDHEVFYEGLISCNIIPEKEKETETIVEFTIADLASKQYLQGVEAKFSKSSEKLMSNQYGKMVYNHAKAGRGIATFLLDGYKECVSIVKIKAGTVNRIEVFLEAV